MALTITGRNVSHKPIIVTGEYAGAGSAGPTTLPLGFVPRLLFILDETNGYSWTWAYGFGWSAIFEDLVDATDANRSHRSRCIFQYLGKELDDNPSETGSDYLEDYIDGDDEAGVIIAHNPAGSGAAGTNPSPNASGVSYLFWAIG